MAMHQITSLLLYSNGSSDVSIAHIERLKHTLSSKKYSHSVPELSEREFPEDREIKWMFDFSEELESAAYDIALTKFLELHEQFILDVVSVDPGVKYLLSALLSIDENLGAFDIKIPRIPPKLAVTKAFEFSYFVWHVSSHDEEAERNPPAALQ
jgi:hypothetical protein